jgi:hypothetical protein
MRKMSLHTLSKNLTDPLSREFAKQNYTQGATHSAGNYNAQQWRWSVVTLQFVEVYFCIVSFKIMINSIADVKLQTLLPLYNCLLVCEPANSAVCITMIFMKVKTPVWLLNTEESHHSTLIYTVISWFHNSTKRSHLLKKVHKLQLYIIQDMLVHTKLYLKLVLL